MTFSEFRHTAVSQLRQAGLDDPVREMELLFAHVVGCNRAQLYIAGNRQMDPDHRLLLERAVARRRLREPLAYICGEWEFWSLPFMVTPDVLIPRPETELLVQRVIDDCRTAGHGQDILEIGIGSGIISTVLARELPRVKMTAIDISPAALQVAAANVRRHVVADQVRLCAGDLCRMPIASPVFDAVVANLPYISASVLEGLQPEVREYEPAGALNGGADGLYYFRVLEQQLPSLLRPGGRLYLEIGYDQAQNLQDIFSGRQYRKQQIHHDLAGLPRLFQADYVAENL